MKISLNYIVVAVVIMILLVLFSLTKSSFDSKYDVSRNIDFEVCKIEITSASRCFFYDAQGNELNFKSYTFFDNCGIEIGDKILKKKYSKEILVYRKDQNGILKLYKTIIPEYW